MSTTIPIQDLDPSTSLPGDCQIRAVVTLSWPYSSSTQQCALLLSERDFRLRARGGQIRVKFSGPAARAVAQGRLGIGDEIILELGTAEWATGAAIHVPGKSVGELHFGQGVRLRLQKEGVDDVEISVADDAVQSVEQEQPAVETTPWRRTLPATSFRSSIGAPGSPTIYSSPAYMRKAAKFSYLDGISRLFEDEWNYQDLPRKRARTSIGDVKSWKVVDRTPSPEPPSPTVAAEVEEEMADASLVEDMTGETTALNNPSTMVSPGVTHETTAETLPNRPSPAPAIVQESSQPASPVGVADPVSSPPALLESENLETDQTLDATTPVAASALPRLDYSPVPPMPQPGSSDDQKEQEANPVTPRLVPMSSAVLPSTTPQISPLATKDTSATAPSVHHSDEAENLPQEVLPFNETVEEDLVVMASPTKATERLLDQLKSTAGESEPATDPVVPEQSEPVNAQEQWETDALAEEDAFSDAEGDEILSAHENDDELMPEDDAEDVFNADELEGEAPSDDDTNEDHDMQIEPAQQWLEESTTEKDSDLEEQISKENTQDKETTQVHRLDDRRSSSHQPGFAPASTLLHAAETPAKALQPPAAIKESPVATSTKKLSFVPDAVPSTEVAEVSTPAATHTDTPKKSIFSGFSGAVPSANVPEAVTPAAKPTGTPKSTPKSARDRVMKRTFHSLFGLKATSSPEKEDPFVDEYTTDFEQAGSRGNDQHIPQLDALHVEHNLSMNADESHSVPDVDTDALNSAVDESVAIKETNLATQVQMQTDAGSLNVQPMMLSENEPLSGEVQDKQIDAMQTAPGTVVHTQSPELINLDPGPDEEEEQYPQGPGTDQTTTDAFTTAPTPQKRPATQDPETNAPAVVGLGPAESTTVPVLDGTAETNMFETRLPDTVRRVDGYDQSEAEQILPDNDHELLDMEVSEAGTGIPAHDDTSAVAQALSPSDQPMSESQKRPLAVCPTPERTVELIESSPIDMNSQNHGEPEILQEPAMEGMFTDGREALLEGDEVSDRPEISEESEIESPSAISPKSITAQDIVEVAEPAQGDDVEMLDDQQREPVSSQASFQSQDGDGPEAPGFDAHSGRPIFSGTAENFSPMGWGSMTQRITDIVSDESALIRLQELESQDDEGNDQLEQEVLDVPSVAQFIGEDSLEQSPTGRKKPQAVDVELQPFEKQNSNHVEDTKGVQPQEPTPQALIENVTQPLEPVDQGVIAMQTHDFVDKLKNLRPADEQVLERQLQVSDEVKNQIPEIPSALSVEHVEQEDSPDKVVEKDKRAHLVAPLSPAATQPIRPQPQLSHAKTHETVMQPTPATSQAQSQSQTGLETANSSKDLTNMAQTVSHEQEPVNMPTPEQMLPPQTPAKKSLRSRLSNVPDVISAWFSPKRSSIVAQESEPKSEVGEPAATSVEVVDKSRTETTRASGVSTSHAYFTSLASLDRYVNLSSQQAGTVDILTVVTNSTKDPTRAKGGPRDYYTIFRVTDASMPSSADVRVEVFRPWKAVLPAADVGDVVLLRAFAVKSKKRKPYLLSTDTSGWCVWRFAEHEKAAARGGSGANEGEKPIWAMRMSHSEVREEVKGPPVEYGMAEKEQARKLRDWWVETRGDVHGGAAGKPGEQGNEEAEVVEL